MEQVLLNPGFYHITQKILKNLDDKSVMTLSKTNKNLLNVCYQFLIEKPQNISYVKGKMIDLCHEISDLFTFIRQNEIHHEIFFKYPWRTRSQNSKELLEKFIQKLVDLCDYNDQNYYWRMSRIIEKFIKFIPSSCPPASEVNLMKLLSFVLRGSGPDIELVRILLAATKDFDTCVRKVLHILKSYDEHWAISHRKVIRKIVIYCCKNPNMPDKFGNTAIHLASDFNYLHIIEELIPYSDNYDIVNEKGKNCLASVVEKLHYRKEHAEIVKNMIVMLGKQKVSNIYKTMPVHLRVKSFFFTTFHRIFPTFQFINYIIGLFAYPLTIGLAILGIDLDED